MKLSLSPLLQLLLVAAAAAAADLQDSDPNNVRAASVYIQPVGAAQAVAAKLPALLAEIRYDVSDPSTAQVAAYEPPEEYEEEEEADGDEKARTASHPAADLYRVGLYDPRTRQWLGATSVAAAANFAKGYSPHFVLTVASGPHTGSYLGVAVRGLAIDAGATRDFGPQATVVVAGAGPTPALNKPVVLNPEGKKLPPPEEKTFLQKYWWAIGLAMLFVMTGGGGGGEEK